MLSKRQALITAKVRTESYSDILESTRHVMFFGTPHQGSLWAGGGTFLNNLTSILAPGNRSRAVEELKLWSSELLAATQDFASVRDRFSITTFWEKKTTNGIQVSHASLCDCCSDLF
jgi:hypothetical protein